MTHSQVAAIESRDQRIAYLERRLQEREDTVAFMADELAYMAVRVVELKAENAHIRTSRHENAAVRRLLREGL